MYKKAFAQQRGSNNYLIHLWEDTGYSKVEWVNQAYVECGEADATHLGLGGEPLKKVRKWDKENNKLHFHDMTPYQKFLVERYKINIPHSSTCLSYQTNITDCGTLGART